VDGEAVGAGYSAVLIDDHPLLIKGVLALLAEGDPPVRTIATGSSIDVALTPIGRSASVVVLDLNLGTADPWRDGLRKLVEAGHRVVVYTDLSDQMTVRQCMRIGACVYVTKGEAEHYLAGAVRAVAKRESFTTPSMTRVIVADGVDGKVQLSQQELRAAIAYCAGTMKTAAASLGISVKTCNGYIERAREKWAKAGRPAHTKTLVAQRLLEEGQATMADLGGDLNLAPGDRFKNVDG
jgi:DNA-binding NarL/FixJ family response regulator